MEKPSHNPGRRVAILTSGGDAPGMNAAIRAAAMLALSRGCEVWGVEHGYRGLVNDELWRLETDDVIGTLREGGTMLGSARCPEFADRAVRDRARENLAARGIDRLLVIGGNGSLTGALALSDIGEAGPHPLAVVGVPASIDNDVALTSRCIGVDTAMNTIVEAVDKITDTAAAHDRAFIVEVMGRDCGYLAMTAAIAVGADAALFPEAGRSEDQIVEGVVKTIRARHRGGRRKRVIIIKAEGVKIAAQALKERVDQRLAELGGGSLETRITILGHVVRGGRPSAFDRLLASRLANAGVQALLSGDSGKMIGWMPPSELPPKIGRRSPVDPYCWIVDLGAALTETKRLLAGSSPLARWRAHAFDELEDVFLL